MRYSGIRAGNFRCRVIGADVSEKELIKTVKRFGLSPNSQYTQLLMQANGFMLPMTRFRPAGTHVKGSQLPTEDDLAFILPLKEKGATNVSKWFAGEMIQEILQSGCLGFTEINEALKDNFDGEQTTVSPDWVIIGITEVGNYLCLGASEHNLDRVGYFDHFTELTEEQMESPHYPVDDLGYDDLFSFLRSLR